jgi:DNA mismatch repair protein MutS
LTDTLAEELPLNRRDGRFVREGFDAALDELRLLQVDSRKVIAQLQARYSAETGCRTLRIKHNSMLGYFVEVPQAVGEDFLKEPWRATFVHRQTMSDAMRFSSVELGELEAKIASAADRALKLELSVFAGLCEAVLAQAEPIKAAAPRSPRSTSSPGLPNSPAAKAGAARSSTTAPPSPSQADATRSWKPR